MKIQNILDLVEHETFIGKYTRLDYKNMYIISFSNPLRLLPNSYRMSKEQFDLCNYLIKLFDSKYLFELNCYAIFSYSTIVAYILYDKNKNVVLLRTDKKYSRTTSKQLTQLENALRSSFNTYFMRYETDRISYKNKFESYVLDFAIFDN